MAGLQKQLNRNLPFGRTFAGTSEHKQGEEQLAFYQHGLYFTHDGSLAEDHPFNADKIEMFKKLGLNVDEPTIEDKIAPEAERIPVNPEIVALLSSKSDEDLLEMSNKLVTVLKKSKTVSDYEPAIEQREENIRFIAQHTS